MILGQLLIAKICEDDRFLGQYVASTTEADPTDPQASRSVWCYIASTPGTCNE